MTAIPIAIPNMEKPKDCEECYISKYIPCNTDYKDCPLIDIVTCKECKYWSEDKQGNTWCEHAIGGLTEANDFCSYGERRGK